MIERNHPQILEWLMVDSCIRDKFVDGLWARLVALREVQSATGEELRPFVGRTLFESELRKVFNG